LADTFLFRLSNKKNTTKIKIALIQALIFDIMVFMEKKKGI